MLPAPMAALAGDVRSAAILVDHTTASATLARELDCRGRRNAQSDFSMPRLSGGQARSREAASLTVMVGGDCRTIFERARPSSIAMQSDHAYRPRGLGPTGKDGEPDLYRRGRTGPVGRRCISRSAPGWILPA